MFFIYISNIFIQNIVKENRVETDNDNVYSEGKLR